jgi:hypothetical protein
MKIMKNKICAAFFIFFSFTACVFALGKAQTEDEIKKQDNEWTLCVTEFDIKSLPQDKMPVAGVITRKIVDRLKDISYRTRVSPEYAYYEGYAWYKTRSAAAKSLSAKLEERSMLFFNGEAEWRYKQNLARVNADIEKLTAAFEEIDSKAPLINKEPEFKLTAGNLTSVYPEPPKEGGEYKFCKDQKADAFLKGTVIDFHGRYSVSIKLYAVFTKNIIYEDSVIFSHEDIDNALDEITSKLMLTLSGNRPAAIAVKIEPKDALVLINKSFAGRGDLGVIERPPGKYEITASANEHESITVETELAEGQIAEINISLLPKEFVNIVVPDPGAGGVVYQGALYAGKAPLTLRLPVNIMEYIDLDSGDGLKGTAVFTTPAENDANYSLPIKPKTPPEKGRVEKARSIYYWSWGGIWVTGIAAWIAYHSYSTSNTTLSHLPGDNLNQDFVDGNVIRYYISMGTLIAVGAVSTFWIYNIVRYLYLANRGSTPVVKPGRNK